MHAGLVQKPVLGLRRLISNAGLVVTGLLASIAIPPASASAQADEASTNDASAIEAREFEVKLIGSGSNRPTISMSENNRTQLLVLLHEGGPGLDLETLEFADGATGIEVAKDLQEVGFVVSTDRGYHPSVAVMTLESVAKHMPVRAEVVEKTFAALSEYAPRALSIAAGMPGFAGMSADDFSFYVLSNGLLDDLQINSVEKEFLKAERTARTGGNYYLSIQENEPGQREEAFSIYGNQSGLYGGVFVGVYGNFRNSMTNFHQMQPARLWPEGADYSTEREDVAARKSELVSRFVASLSGEALSDADRDTLVALGWLDADGNRAIPVFTAADQAMIPELVGGFTPTLVSILEEERSFLKARYDASPYAGEITFEEYLIWWYHLFYSRVTDRLLEEGLAKLPESRVATYMFIP